MMYHTGKYSVLIIFFTMRHFFSFAIKVTAPPSPSFPPPNSRPLIEVPQILLAITTEQYIHRGLQQYHE